MATPAPSVVPAQLGFLAIYNPSLGANDETVDDQIVYYASVSKTSLAGQQRRRQARSKAARPADHLSQEERNERLRQIGLAQGMVEFGKSFSGNHAVDTIDTEKGRVVLHELEPGWWILASVDLTRVSLPPSKPASGPSAPSHTQAPTAGADNGIEYSSREVKPSVLLLQDLLRAHSVFLLHHDSSLSALFVRSKRPKFVGMLGRYWDLFLSTWNVMLHGNPICSVLGGIKIAASGELGIGVGEEDRGSGEREVLEGLIVRTDGLLDMVVGRFGEGDSENRSVSEKDRDQADGDQWLGTGQEPGAEDGAIFLGLGALSRHSLRDLMYWMEDLYTWGENAYGVINSPTATRPRPKRPRPTTVSKNVAPRPPATIPTDNNNETVKMMTSDSGDRAKKAAGPSPLNDDASSPGDSEVESGGMEKIISYLKLGYGTSWSLGTSPSAGSEDGITKAGGQAPSASPSTPLSRRRFKDDNSGRFLIGLMGDVEEADSDDNDAGADHVNPEDELNSNNRTMLRTVTVELESEGEDRPEAQITKDLGSHDTELSEQKLNYEGKVTETVNATFDSQDRNKTKRLRVVVYVNKPFIFVFLFQLHIDSLAWDGLYRSLHYQLAPLMRPLTASTRYRPERPDVGAAQIYDLVWDPLALTMQSTIPNIPSPVATNLPSWVPATAKTRRLAWNRMEALNTHLQLLNIYAATRPDPSQLEHTAKTSRGWWIVWNRILKREIRYRSSSEEAEANGRRASDGELGAQALIDGSDEPTPIEEVVISKEIFLVRKAGDHGSGAKSNNASHMTSTRPAGAWTEGASRLAQGIGVDTRRYIEGLLNLA